MLSIVHAPNTVLSEKAKAVSKVDASIKTLFSEMKKTLAAQKDPEGVGLAAPQVGKSVQIFIIKPTPAAKEQIFINPTITLHKDKKRKKKNESHTKLEGCLSLPNIWGEVQRTDKVTVTYLDENGREHTKDFSGFSATVIQHEYDHLQGILFPKRVLEQKGELYKSHKENGKDVFEEMKI